MHLQVPKHQWWPHIADLHVWQQGRPGVYQLKPPATWESHCTCLILGACGQKHSLLSQVLQIHDAGACTLEILSCGSGRGGCNISASTFIIIIILYIYIFFAVSGLRFHARAFSSCGKRGPLFIAVRGPFTLAASLVVEHRLQTRRLSSCGSRA